MQPTFSQPAPVLDPARVIADHDLRELYDDFLRAILGVHDDVRLETTRTETRVFFRDTPLCRVVAYRQLFHVQVGKESVWEIRVRDRRSCSETLHRILARLLDVYAAEARNRR